MALPTREVGIISCSGEDVPGGIIALVATRLVLEKLRPDKTVTICLPLFLAGDKNERDFAKIFPTITVDGCEKRCAQIATSNLSGKPAYSIVVSDIAKKHPEVVLKSRDKLTEDEMRIAEEVAEEIAARVDEILKRRSTSNG
ncbi:MAG: putative zinc-binding protein [Candidatus Bathyarchaeia archaeon]